MDSNLALTLEPRQCQVCHTRAGLQRCSGCKVVFYCSREHQASHRDSHKHACTHVRKALAALAREEDALHSEEQGSLYAGTDLFEDHIGHFWRNYMQARGAVVDNTLGHFNNTDAVRASLDHVTDMLRLRRGDGQGLRQVVPALYLRLGRDQECYNFIKWRATVHERDDFDEGDMDKPYLDVGGADVLESPKRLWPGAWLELGHAACVVLVKVRILLDLQHMQNAARAFRGVLPWEIINEIRGQALVSGVVASRRDIKLASAERTAELMRLVKGQIKKLFKRITSYSPKFWRILLDPPSVSESRPYAYSSPRSDEEATVMAMYNSRAWRETPGSIEVIQSLIKVPWRGIPGSIEAIKRLMEVP